jgi:hypothetical protein
MSKRRVRRHGKRYRLAVVATVALVAGIGAAIFFWPGGSREMPPAYALAPESVLPADIQRAPAQVRETYRFAVANREVLRWIPCYCGCGADGHTSNASCYLKDFSTSGKLVFDRMSLN